jgi:signal transduction histidine kinase
VVQESVTNMMKQSAATEARLTVTRQAKSVIVRMEDNGRGFDAESPERASDGFGVSGMAERARILGARYAIRSVPGKGTTVLLDIPVTEEHA